MSQKNADNAKGWQNLVSGGTVYISENNFHASSTQDDEQKSFSVFSAQNLDSVDDLVQRVRSHIYDDIQKLHGTMPLWGVDCWVPLGDLFVDVNLLEQVSSSRRSELDNLWQDFTDGKSTYRSLDRIGLGKGQQRVSGLEVLERNTNLMVLGKPGSGKTTYLQRIVIECNAGTVQGKRIPMLIRLREFLDDGEPFEYSLERTLSDCWNISEAEVKSICKQGRSLILLDGLDEVTGERGKQISKRIKQFARMYPHSLLIVTCRTQSQESRFERFDYVEVADFDEPQVRAFAEHWFIAIMGNSSICLKMLTTFLEQLFRDENKPIRELAITPILLSLTCAVFNQMGKFYSKRSRLYEEGLSILLEQWDKSREIERDEIYRNLPISRKLELLSYLAVKKFKQDQYILFEQTELEEYIAVFLRSSREEACSVLRSIESQHGLLIERAQGIWSFSHLTFQEYFVAYEVSENCQSNFCSSIFLKNLVEQVVKFRIKNGRYMRKNRWREVFLLTAELLKDSNQILELVNLRIQEMIMSQNLITYLTWSDQVTRESRSSFKSAVKRVTAISISCSLSPNFLNNMLLGECDNVIKQIIDHLEKSDTIKEVLNEFQRLGSYRFKPSIAIIDRSKRLIPKICSLSIFTTINFDDLMQDLLFLEENLDLGPIENNPHHEKVRLIVSKVLEIWGDYFGLRFLWNSIVKLEYDLMDCLMANEIMLKCKQDSRNISIDDWQRIENEILLFVNPTTVVSKLQYK